MEYGKYMTCVEVTAAGQVLPWTRELNPLSRPPSTKLTDKLTVQVWTQAKKKSRRPPTEKRKVIECQPVR